MILEQELLPFREWLLGDWWRGGSHWGAVLSFIAIVFAVGVLSLVLGFLVALVRNGPLKAGDLTYRVVTNGFAELLRTSPSRVWTLARHAVIESMRRRVWVALVVFALVLVFAGWFLQTGYRDPGRLFIGFALTTTTFLVVLIAVLLSSFSLPQEFRSKTIYTLMTKPVRAGDVVVGRILGFTLVGTAMLILMSVANYVFISRMLGHTHDVEIASLEDIVDSGGRLLGKKGRTTSSQAHRHELSLDANGNGIALYANGHEHIVTATQRNGGVTYELSGPIGNIRARVPQYGKLRFLDRKGTELARGISVGAEWTYRSFIEGGTQGAAIWTLDHIDESKFIRAKDGSQVLPLELSVRVFRTFKGIIGQGIQGSMQLRNPDDPSVKSAIWTFTARDASGGTLSSASTLGASDNLPSINYFAWPRNFDDSNRKPIDILKDVVTKDGRLEVVVMCLEREQYYGFAQPDMYVRMADASPLLNYAKVQFSIWIQMLLVIAIAVAASTFVNGPVALLFTIAFVILGYSRQFFVDVATGAQIGGGPVESLVRLITQKNLMSGLEKGFGVQLMRSSDWVLNHIMLSVAYVLPDFSSYSTVDYVSQGFDIPLNKVFQDLTFGLSYVAGVCVFGYFFLRTREVAK